MYRSCLLLSVAAICAIAGPLLETYEVPELDLFESFKREYGKIYSSASEEAERRLVFEDNLDYINQHNQEYMHGKSSFYLGVNEYTDLRLHEFLGPAYSNNMIRSSLKRKIFRPPAFNDDPSSLDWRTNGSVTKVKNQGKCNSDWAFSAAGALEGQYYFGRRQLIDFSVQQLIDCPNSQPNYTTHGCAGGIPTNAYLSITETGGIEGDKDYPYTAQNGTCKYNDSASKTGIGGWVEMGDYPNEVTLQQMVVFYGPLSVRFDGNHRSFQHYKGGIYDEPNCSNTSLNHAALLVGYNTTPDYWIVKNSIGESWGEQGYIRMSRNKDNQCGISNNASVPF